MFKDIKNILILSLLIISLFFGYKWYFGTDKESKEKIELLNNENEKLKQERKEIDLRIKNLEKEYNDRDLVIKEKEKKISIMDSTINLLENKVSISKSELSKARKELLEKSKKIDELKKNPIKRDGDELIESLKNKLLK